MTRELDVTAAIRSFGFTPPIGETEVEDIRSQPDSPERTAILEFVENDIRERVGTPFESGISIAEAQRRMDQLKADQVEAWKRAIGGVIYERRRLLHWAAWVCRDNDVYGTDDDTAGSASDYLDKFFGDTSFRKAALGRLRLRCPPLSKESTGHIGFVTLSPIPSPRTISCISAVCLPPHSG